MADRTSSEYASDKAWNSLLSMASTSSPTGMCSFLLNLAQILVLSMHHHGRCGVSESAVQKRSPRSRRCPRAANRQANGGGERDHNVLRASSEFGIQRGPPAHTVAWYARPPPCSLAALRRRAAVGWKVHVRMCDSLVRRARASSGPGRRLGGARARHILHTH